MKRIKLYEAFALLGSTGGGLFLGASALFDLDLSGDLTRWLIFGYVICNFVVIGHFVNE